MACPVPMSFDDARAQLVLEQPVLMTLHVLRSFVRQHHGDLGLRIRHRPDRHEVAEPKGQYLLVLSTLGTEIGECARCQAFGAITRGKLLKLFVRQKVHGISAFACSTASEPGWTRDRVDALSG